MRAVSRYVWVSSCFVWRVGKRRVARFGFGIGNAGRRYIRPQACWRAVAGLSRCVRFRAVLIRPRCENACGKFPS
jgi:hypothetical protein